MQTPIHSQAPTREPTEDSNTQVSPSTLQQEAADCNELASIVNATPQVTTQTNDTDHNNVPIPSDNDVSTLEHADLRPSMMARLLENLEKQRCIKSDALASKKREEKAAIEKARERQRQKEALLKLALEEQAIEEQVKLALKKQASEAHDLEAEMQPEVDPVYDSRTRTPLTTGANSLANSAHCDAASKKVVAESSDGPWPQSLNHMKVEGNQKSRRIELQKSDKWHVPDIRGTGDLILPSVRVDWDACRGRGRTAGAHGSAGSDAQIAVDSQLKRYVDFWLETAHDRCGKEILFADRDGHWFCDIDTRHGKLLEPLQYKDVPLREYSRTLDRSRNRS